MVGKISAREFVEKGERFIGHVAAVVAGFILMVLGLGMGVTMVMLPAGLVIGIIGVLVFVWGLFGHLEGRKGADR